VQSFLSATVYLHWLDVSLDRGRLPGFVLALCRLTCAWLEANISAISVSDPISHRFRDMATYRLELSAENLRQTAACGYMVTTDSL